MWYVEKDSLKEEKNGYQKCTKKDILEFIVC